MTERERLIEILKNNYSCRIKDCKKCGWGDKCSLHIEADYLLENGVIVPPVMAGQKVYLSRSLMNDVIEGEVTGLKTTEFSRYTVVFLIDDNRYIEIPFGAYGKTVFLTKEEAEKALEEMKKND